MSSPMKQPLIFLLCLGVLNCAYSNVSPVDRDGNGIPDTWQLRYGIPEDEWDLDHDGDGQTTREEGLNGTNPKDASSRFGMGGLTINSYEDYDEIIVGVHAGRGALVNIYSSENLNNWDFEYGLSIWEIGENDFYDSPLGILPSNLFYRAEFVEWEDGDFDGIADVDEYISGAEVPYFFDDTDSDFISDDWEREHFSNLTTVSTFWEPVSGTYTVPDTDNDLVSDFIESALESNPKSNDTDGDGLKDGDEFELNSSLTNEDTDGDGAGDLIEASIGSSLLDRDSDNDGVSDLSEIESGTDSLDEIETVEMVRVRFLLQELADINQFYFQEQNRYEPTSFDILDFGLEGTRSYNPDRYFYNRPSGYSSTQSRSIDNYNRIQSYLNYDLRNSYYYPYDSSEVRSVEEFWSTSIARLEAEMPLRYRVNDDGNTVVHTINYSGTVGDVISWSSSDFGGFEFNFSTSKAYSSLDVILLCLHLYAEDVFPKLAMQGPPQKDDHFFYYLRFYLDDLGLELESRAFEFDGLFTFMYPAKPLPVDSQLDGLFLETTAIEAEYSMAQIISTNQVSPEDFTVSPSIPAFYHPESPVGSLGYIEFDVMLPRKTLFMKNYFGADGYYPMQYSLSVLGIVDPETEQISDAIPPEIIFDDPTSNLLNNEETSLLSFPSAIVVDSNNPNRSSSYQLHVTGLQSSIELRASEALGIANSDAEWLVDDEFLPGLQATKTFNDTAETPIFLLPEKIEHEVRFMPYTEQQMRRKVIVYDDSIVDLGSLSEEISSFYDAVSGALPPVVQELGDGIKDSGFAIVGNHRWEEFPDNPNVLWAFDIEVTTGTLLEFELEADATKILGPALDQAIEQLGLKVDLELFVEGGLELNIGASRSTSDPLGTITGGPSGNIDVGIEVEIKQDGITLVGYELIEGREAEGKAFTSIVAEGEFVYDRKNRELSIDLIVILKPITFSLEFSREGQTEYSDEWEPFKEIVLYRKKFMILKGDVNE